MPKFLSALKFLQKDAPPPPPTHYDAALAHYENALATLQELVVAPVRHALEEGVVPKLLRQSIPDLDDIKQRIPDSIRLPDNVLGQYVPQEVRSTIERRAEDLERLAGEFVADKSHSELIFLASVLLAFVLFVVVLPAYEALFGTAAKVDAEESEKEHVVTSSESAGGPRLGGGTKMVDVRDIPSMTFLRSASGGSNASEFTMGTTGGSVGSGSMETVIEESGAVKEEEEAEKEEDDDVLAALKKNRASQKKRIQEEENARNAALAAVSNKPDRYVFEEEKKEEEPEVQELVHACEGIVHKNKSIKKDSREGRKKKVDRAASMSVLTATNSKNEESAEEKARYNEFLSFLNSTEAVSPRSLTIQEDAPHVKDKKVGQRDYYAEPSKVSPHASSRKEEESVGSSASSLTASSQRSASSISRSMKKRLSKNGRKTLKKMTSSVW